MPAFIEEIVLPFVNFGRTWKSPRTQETERWVVPRLTQHFNRDINDITGRVVLDYRVRRLQDGASPETVKRELAVASAAVSWCRELGEDLNNPFAGRLITRAERRSAKPPREAPSHETIAALLLLSDGVVQDIIEFAVSTGFRLSEILNLRWAQIDGDVVHFAPEQQKSRRHGKRILGPVALSVLSRREQGEYVFTRAGKPLTRYQFRVQWNKIQVPGVRFHDLRRYFASELQKRARLEDVRLQLGHADVRTTQRYITDDFTSLRKALSAPQWG